MEARFQLKWWRMIGVCPLGAQVRLVTGSSETPLSSQNTMAALRRRAFLPDPWPVGGDPAGDRPLVAFGGAAGGALQPVAHAAAQQLPDVAGMVGDPGQPLDHRGDALKGPVVGVEAVGAGALPERLVDRLQLLVGQAGRRPGGAGAAQRLRAAPAPVGVAAADGLAGGTQFPGDLGLGAAGGEQLAGLHADVFERLAVAQTAGVASVGGWSHAAILPGQPRFCHRNERASLAPPCSALRRAWRNIPYQRVPHLVPRGTGSHSVVGGDQAWTDESCSRWPDWDRLVSQPCRSPLGPPKQPTVNPASTLCR